MAKFGAGFFLGFFHLGSIMSLDLEFRGHYPHTFLKKAKWFLKSKVDIVITSVHLSALGRGQKDKHHLISITKSISKIFFTKFCVCSH